MENRIHDLIRELQWETTRCQIVGTLLGQVSQDFILIKGIRVSDREEGFSLLRDFDVTYRPYENEEDAVRDTCPGDILIRRKDYKPLTEKERQKRIDEIDAFLRRE